MATNNSLTNLRQTTGRYLGRYEVGAFQSSSNSATTGVDPNLISSLSIGDQFVDMYLALTGKTGADQLSRIVTGYTPSTGTLSVDRAWTGSSVPNSATYELSSLIEPVTQMLQIINDTLRRMFVVVEVTLTPVANAIRHDVTTANTWLIDPKYVRQVGYLMSTETRATTDPFTGGRLIHGSAITQDGDVYIDHWPRTGATNETWYLRCLKPAYAHCRASGGNYGDQSGLALETDEAPVEPEWLAWSAICLAFEENWLNLGIDDDAQLAKKYEHATRMAASYARRWKFDHRADTTLLFKKVGPGFGPYPGRAAWVVAR